MLSSLEQRKLSYDFKHGIKQIRQYVYYLTTVVGLSGCIKSWSIIGLDNYPSLFEEFIILKISKWCKIMAT